MTGPIETGLPEPERRFEARDYALYLRRRWGFIAASCGVAVAVTLAVSLLLPKRYTSTASIVIEAPAGTDSRTFTAISPIYLESLKTYETFAMSGALFQRALDKFHLREQDGASIESIKSRVLKVAKLRDTKVMQISVTLENPKQAQAMAQFMAEETVKLISSVSHANGREMLDEIQAQADAVQKKLEQAQAALAKVNAAYPVAALQTELESLIALQHRMRRELYEAEAAAAANDSPGARSRVAALSQRSKELDESVKTKSKTLADASSQTDRLDAERKSAQALYDAATRRLQDSRSWVGSSGERLQVIDPGIVPERPSEPRPALYTLIAGALALLGAIVYLSIGYGLRV